MSIDFLTELERSLESGKEVFACPGVGKNQWVMGKSVEELRKMAKRAADSKKLEARIVRLVTKGEAVAGDFFLVPVRIGEPGTRGEPQIEWSVVETKEAAETMRDVRRGPSPFFTMQIQESVQPTATGVQS